MTVFVQWNKQKSLVSIGLGQSFWVEIKNLQNQLFTDKVCRLLFWIFSFDIFSKKLFFNLSNSQIYILNNKKMPHAFTVLHVSVIQIQSLQPINTFSKINYYSMLPKKLVYNLAAWIFWNLMRYTSLYLSAVGNSSNILYSWTTP